MQQHPLISMLFLWTCLLFCALTAVASSDEQLSKANNAFAVELYRKIGDANRGKNLFFSPISISSAFGMVSLGAKGATRDQTKSALSLDKMSSDDAVKQAYKQLLASFKGQTANYTLSIVNRLFGSNVLQFHQQFLDDTQTYFEASLEKLDFAGKPDDSRVHINQWVEEQTNRKIRDLLPSGTIDARTILVIVNAIYFNALWVTPFSETSTKSRPFSVSRSAQENIATMYLRDTYLNYHNSSELSCEVLELPYHGGKSSMYVFLPHDVEGLPNLEKQLTGEKLAETVSKVQGNTVSVQLPKFLIDQDISLKQFLQMLGMVDGFDATKADLSGISSGKLVITDAVHKAFVNVSETGTEAAAATGVIIGLTSIRNSISFNANRPFLFFIYEKNAKSVLFMGRLVRPPTSKESIGKFGETAALQSSTVSIYASASALLTALGLLLAHWRLQ